MALLNRRRRIGGDGTKPLYPFLERPAATFRIEASAQ